MRVPRWLLCAVLLAGCGDDEGTRTDGAVMFPDSGPVADSGPDGAAFVSPVKLSETGLYADIATKQVTAGLLEFVPRWELWSDAATKRRWIKLPTGSQIDTSDMNQWRFPVGTKLWKEFSRGGRRIETRLMQKLGPGEDWFMMSYAWDQAETEATAVPIGVVDDNGQNDIPAQSECFDCHSPVRLPSVIIGFSALSLDTATAGTPSILEQLVTGGRLTAPPAGPGGATPYLPLPAGDVTRAALGYLHTNCGSCHNSRSDVKFAVNLELRLAVGLADWPASAPYRFAVDVRNELSAPGATAIVEPGLPDASALYHRLTTTGQLRMPPLARELADPVGGEAVRAWIASLPPTP